MSENQYTPGVCNIGKAEIERRKSKLVLGILLILIATAFVLYLPYSVLLFSVLYSLSFYSAILIFQIRQRFCILFGWLKLYNFNDTQERKQKVVNKEWIAKDRNQMLRILFYAALSSSVYCMLIFYVAKTIKSSFQF